MSQNRDREEAIFDAARELAPGAARAAYLLEECGQDAELRKRIEAMLEADGAAAEFFETQPGGAGTLRLSTSAISPLTEKPGDKIGRYKLLQKLGEGGCGLVYMAEQIEPVKRRVALKLIKLGMDTKVVVARFEAERQALALMDHPNIAKVLDAGSTDSGRPYFIMELVRGVRITDYCDQANLSTGERLALFVQICQAVQHAHQKGIIHRDLKPSNILVTVNDGVPVPKVIDFGISKATTGQQLTDKTLFTAYEQFIGTPAYMSPEQAVLTSLDIDTRTDIYSLGVLLYEMLTGRTPFDANDLLQAGLDEMRRRIREEEPQRPSTRLSTMMDADLTTVAKHHGAQPPALISLLRGDLDWIVMKALEKDRRRRYETANGLAMDIQRHLNNEPVVARPPSPLYRLQKLARRNRVAVAAVAAVSAALLIGLTISAWQAVRATRAQRLEQNARLAADGARARESQQRQLAEANARKATESEREAHRLLYAADMKLAHTSWEEGNLSRMTRLLEDHRPRSGEEDARGFEYYYLQELARGEQDFILPGHTNSVQRIAISPDGKWMASRGDTDTRLWDMTRRSLTGVWPSAKVDLWKAPRAFLGISFSYDSRFLAFPSERGLELADLATHQTRLLQSGAIDNPLFSPVTNLVAFDSDAAGAGIRVWDYIANKDVGSVGPNRALWSWAPDGSRLLAGYASGTASSLEWWDPSSFKVAETGHAGQYIYGTAVSPDGRITAAADWQGEIWLMETPGGKLLGKLDCGDIRTCALAFSPDGKFLATSSRDQAILIWNLESRTRSHQLRGHHAKVTNLAYTPEGRWLVSGDEDGKLLLWDTARENHRPQIANRMPGFGVNPPQFSADGKLVALATAENQWSLLDSSTLQVQSSLKGELVSFSPDSRKAAVLASVARQPTLWVSVLDAPAHQATIPLATPSVQQSNPQISPDGRFLSVDKFGSAEGILIFAAATGERLLSIPHSDQAEIAPHQFLPDNRTLVCSEGTSMGFWDLDSRRKTRSEPAGASIISLAVSQTGRYLAVGCEDSRLLLWDLRSGAAPRALAGHQAMVWALCFSSDERTLASGGEDRTLKLWDLASLREVASFPQEKALYWLAFSPDNQTLVSGGIGFYEIWRAPRDEPLDHSRALSRFVTDLPSTSLWRVPDGNTLPPKQLLVEQQLCLSNLLNIHRAIMAYNKDHGGLPDWLGDLVPKYLPDTNCLRCPVEVATGLHSSWLPTGDPKVTTSYSYEFSALTNRTSDLYGLAAPGDTLKAWKARQLARYGGVVPVLRCSEHRAVLNITYAGDFLETGVMWEDEADAKWRAGHPESAEKWCRQMEQEGKPQDLNQLAWRLATSANPQVRDGRTAVRLAERAVDLTKRKNPNLLDTLAAAYAETGQFNKALTIQLEAISIIKGDPQTSGDDGTLKEMQERQELYRRGQPYHDAE
ncbi:MAG TPA: protein kinase [Verrucomicrobiae bacterium]|nr:protein kinase [Verrucomicrobiae bacterium]